MTTFDVEVGGAIRTVTIHRKGHLLHVELGGKTHVVDARRVGDAMWSLLIGPDNTKSPVTSVDVALAAGTAAGAFDVHVAGQTIPVQIRQAGAFGRQTREGDSPAGPGAAGPQRLVAPMPGKVVRVLVKAGDLVKARQGLVVVEAMKMENELRAARDGRVRDVAVTEGQSVDAGAALVVVE
jgi:biotin carboxyl carrier protein